MTSHDWEDVPGSDAPYQIRGGITVHKIVRRCKRCGFETSALVHYDDKPPEDCDETLAAGVMKS